jgi:hypothetical protein
MRKAPLCLLGVFLLIVFLLLVAYPFYNTQVTVVSVDRVGRDCICSLQWRGYDHTTLEITRLADLGRTSGEFTKLVDDGDVFNLTVTQDYSWFEIHFYGKTAILHGDGTLIML